MDEVGQPPEFLVTEALQRPGPFATPPCCQYLSPPLAIDLQPPLPQAAGPLLFWSGSLERRPHPLPPDPPADARVRGLLRLRRPGPDPLTGAALVQALNHRRHP